ncbi:MAG: choice-of-anchor B family protein [Bacteroidia bacterium]|jgi:choice-of-anchor B domain-containing protein
MKRYYLLLFALILLAFSANAQYSNQNVSLLSHWFNPDEVAEPQLGIKYQGVWGWVDVYDGKEYAIIGSSSGTYIIDVSTPTAPVVRDYVPGRRDQCIWREYKTYGNYLYASSDDQSPNSFQIMDLSYLPDSVHVVHDDVTIFERAHTLYIDGDKLYCGSVTLPNGSGYHSMAVYSLANPEYPTLLRTLHQDDSTISFAHDMFVRNDTVYASCGYQGLFIYKFNADTTFSLINSLTSYPEQGYNHSSFLAPDGRTLIFCDEVPRDKPVKLLDVSDLQNMSVTSTFKSNEGATPHNPYIFGSNKAVIAYYQDGVQIYDIGNPAAPVRTGYFDTDTLDGPNNNYNPSGTAYHGCWGAYVDLPSGILLASDMQNGLFVLNADLALGTNDTQNASTGKATIYPNPAADNVSVMLQLKNKDELSMEVFDITGRKITGKKEVALPGSSVKIIQTEHLSPGVYIIKITGKEINYAQQLITQ